MSRRVRSSVPRRPKLSSATGLPSVYDCRKSLRAHRSIEKPGNLRSPEYAATSPDSARAAAANVQFDNSLISPRKVCFPLTLYYNFPMIQTVSGALEKFQDAVGIKFQLYNS